MIELLIAILATYRLAQLISVDDGPNDIFLRFRAWMGAYDYDEYGLPKSMWGRLVLCPYCTGIYIALLVTIITIDVTSSTGEFFLLWMGVAGGQSFLWGVTVH